MELKHAVEELSALAQETRLATYRLLVQAGPDGLVAGEISDCLEVPANTLSFHLNQLRTSGLVHSERQGRNLRYRADFDAMNGLLAFLTENCCGTGCSAQLPDPECCSDGAVS